MKFTASRILDFGKIIASAVGQQIPDFFKYMSQFIEQTARSLRNGLTFADNVACEILEVSLTTGTPQTVKTKQLPVVGVIPIGCSSTTAGLSTFLCYMSPDSQFTVGARFAALSDGSTVAGPLTVTLVILF